MQKPPEFSFPDLGRAVEALSPEEIDNLSYGVVKLDAEGVVRLYNKTEARLSGYKNRQALGLSFFTEVAPCMRNAYFTDRIEKARRLGKLDISFSFTGDFNDQTRELDVRIQSANDGGIWIFHQRPPAAEMP